MDRDDAIISRFDTNLTAGVVYKVVDEGQLDTMAYRGWALVAVLYTDTVVPAYETESVPCRDPNNGYALYTDTKTKAAHHVVRQARFLVRLDENSALLQKSEELDDAKGAANAANQALEESEEKYTKLAKEAEKLRADLASSKSNHERVVNAHGETLSLKRKLEGDIGKIREAIGAKQMKEILGTP